MYKRQVQSWGFYELYSINVGSKNNNAESDRGQRGLNSPYGRRGAICAHFGWSWDYLHNGIAWAIVQRIMVDLPSYDSEDKGEEEIALNSENADNIMNFINNMM